MPVEVEKIVYVDKIVEKVIERIVERHVSAHLCVLSVRGTTGATTTGASSECMHHFPDPHSESTLPAPEVPSGARAQQARGRPWHLSYRSSACQVWACDRFHGVQVPVEVERVVEKRVEIEVCRVHNFLFRRANSAVSAVIAAADMISAPGMCVTST